MFSFLLVYGVVWSALVAREGRTALRLVWYDVSYGVELPCYWMEWIRKDIICPTPGYGRCILWVKSWGMICEFRDLSKVKFRYQNGVPTPYTSVAAHHPNTNESPLCAIGKIASNGNTAVRRIGKQCNNLNLWHHLQYCTKLLCRSFALEEIKQDGTLHEIVYLRDMRRCWIDWEVTLCSFAVSRLVGFWDDS